MNSWLWQQMLESRTSSLCLAFAFVFFVSVYNLADIGKSLEEQGSGTSKGTAPALRSKEAAPARACTAGVANDSMSLSLRHSEGYMAEPEDTWNVRLERQRQQMRVQHDAMTRCYSVQELGWIGSQQPCLPKCKDHLDASLKAEERQCTRAVFWQVHYEPSFSCVGEQRIGNVGDGGKWVCDPFRLRASIASGKSCLVYSIGSHGQYDFEEAVHKQISPLCEIHTVDKKHWKKYTNIAPPSYVTYHTTQVGSPPHGKLISTIMEGQGHKGRVIDIFKIDCEGCEFPTLRSWFANGVYIRQILLEIHINRDLNFEPTHELFQYLFDLGYVVFHKEPNTIVNSKCIEYAFLKMSPEFVGQVRST